MKEGGAMRFCFFVYVCSGDASLFLCESLKERCDFVSFFLFTFDEMAMRFCCFVCVRDGGAILLLCEGLK